MRLQQGMPTRHFVRTQHSAGCMANSCFASFLNFLGFFCLDLQLVEPADVKRVDMEGGLYCVQTGSMRAKAEATITVKEALSFKVILNS